MISYVSIAVTFLIALVTLIAKTEKANDRKHIVNLNKFGILMLALLIISSLVSIWIQYASDTDTEKKKTEVEKIRIKDSLIAENRFTVQAKKFQQTIEILNAQNGYLNYAKKNDSLRFLISLDKFNRQLNSQKITIDNINMVLHPLFPLQLYCEFKIEASAFPSFFRETLISFDSVIARYWRRDDSDFPKHIIFDPINKHFLPKEWEVQSSYEKFYRSIHKIDPNLVYSFLNVDSPWVEKSEQDIDPHDSPDNKIETAVTSFLPEHFYLSIKGFGNEEKISFDFFLPDGEMQYEYLKAGDYVYIYFYKTIPASMINKKTIQSFEECDNDSLKILLSNNHYYTQTKLTKLVLNCGNDFKSAYTFKMINPSLIKTGHSTFYSYNSLIDLNKSKYNVGAYLNN